MTRHLLKLIWHRRRINLLIMVEVLLSFLVLAAVVTMAVFYADNYRKPLGFVVEGVWTIGIDTHANQAQQFISVDVESVKAPRRTPSELLARIGNLMSVVRDQPGVEAAAAAMVLPYGHSTWTSSENIRGRAIDYGVGFGSDDFARVFNLELLGGRWFNRADDAAAGFEPVVINQRLARDMFGAGDAVGAIIPRDKPPENPEEARKNPPAKVVGVVRDFRKDGEFSPAGNFMFHRVSFTSTDDDPVIPRAIVLRVGPGLRAGEFEERMVKRLRAAAPDWSFEVSPLSQARETTLRAWLAPVVGAGVISGFLLLMVAMGLTGVLWLNVTQRTREIGLRRATGATIPSIRHQVLGEVLVLTSLAVAAGTLIALQFPLLDLLGAIGGGVYSVGLVISVACIYLLSIGCAWAPSRLATSVSPAEALRYE
jgi:putative ABC transport system permease protein